MTLSGYAKYTEKTRTELIEEIIRLNRELLAKNKEISVLKDRVRIYKSLK